MAIRIVAILTAAMRMATVFVVAIFMAAGCCHGGRKGRHYYIRQDVPAFHGGSAFMTALSEGKGLAVSSR